MTEDKKYELVEIPTQMGLAIKTPDDETISQLELLIKIANSLEELKKAMIGEK